MKQLVIIIEFPDSVGADEIKQYASSALERWGGQLRSDDHLFSTVKAPMHRMMILNNRDRQALARYIARRQK